MIVDWFDASGGPIADGRSLVAEVAQRRREPACALRAQDPVTLGGYEA